MVREALLGMNRGFMRSPHVFLRILVSLPVHEHASRKVRSHVEKGSSIGKIGWGQSNMGTPFGYLIDAIRESGVRQVTSCVVHKLLGVGAEV